jgi:2-phosphosulfolactate phosphatase
VVYASALFSHAAAGELRGRVVVVIDVLRASSTVTAALMAGARGVRLVGTPAEALALRGGAGGQQVVLGGERGGVLIPGFDLDNTPGKYTRERVGGREVVFTTTNGTAAALHGGLAGRMYFGCFAHLSALVEMLDGAGGEVQLLCAGTNGRVSFEDCLLAGAVAAGLAERGWAFGEDDGARLMAGAWRGVCEGAEGPAGAGLSARVHAALLESAGGRNLVELGLGADVEWCAQVDRTGVVPEVSVVGMVARVAGGREEG